jgi:hypothetical protein
MSRKGNSASHRTTTRSQLVEDKTPREGEKASFAGNDTQKLKNRKANKKTWAGQ